MHSTIPNFALFVEFHLFESDIYFIDFVFYLHSPAQLACHFMWFLHLQSGFLKVTYYPDDTVHAKILLNLFKTSGFNNGLKLHWKCYGEIVGKKIWILRANLMQAIQCSVEMIIMLFWLGKHFRGCLFKRGGVYQSKYGICDMIKGNESDVADIDFEL